MRPFGSDPVKVPTLSQSPPAIEYRIEPGLTVRVKVSQELVGYGDGPQNINVFVPIFEYMRYGEFRSISDDNHEVVLAQENR